MEEMDKDIKKLAGEDFPVLLREIDDPPEQLFIKGTLPPQEHKILCVVGSRKYTGYGKQLTKVLLSALRSLPITVVSGLALGIDALAHKAALDVGLHTVAVPGSGLDRSVIAPRTNVWLADEILTRGGALVSELEPMTKASPWAFPARNRIMAGLSHAVLVIEAGERSGTLITARLAREYNRDVLAVPGSILNDNSCGTNKLIRDGAVPVTSADVLVESLGFSPEERGGELVDSSELSEEERKVIDLLSEAKRRDELIRQSGLSASKANMVITVLEMKGMLKEEMGKVHKAV